MVTPTSSTASDLRVRPRGAWYVLVFALWIAAAVLIGTVAGTAIRVIDHGVTPIGASHVVDIPTSGLTIYSEVQPANRQCYLQSPSGRTIVMQGLSYDLSASFNGTTVYAVASTPDGLAAGTYRISCPGLGPLGAQSLYYGDQIPFASMAARGVVAVILGLLGAILLVVLLVRRHISKSRIRQQQLAMSGYGGGYGPGGYGTGGYGQPGYPGGGYGSAGTGAGGYGGTSVPPPSGWSGGTTPPVDAPQPSYGQQPPGEQQPPYGQQPPGEQPPPYGQPPP